MPELLRMPAIAANTTEAVVSAWAVAEGGAFAVGDPLIAVEIDKATVDVPAEAAGVLIRRLVDEGTVVEAGLPIALLGAVGEVVEDVDRVIVELGIERRTAAVRWSGGAGEQATNGGPAQPAGREDAGLPWRRSRVFASPVARRVAQAARVDLTEVRGTGPGGRIRKQDVEAVIVGRIDRRPVLAGPAGGPPLPAPITAAPVAATAAAPAPAARGAVGPPAIEFPPGADEVLVPMTQMRKGIAAQMTRALAVPHAYLTMEVEATGLVRVREAARREYQAREGLSLSFVPFVVKACVQALRRNPTLNAHWTEAGLLAKRHINVGVAVAVDEGLIVPVIRDVDQASISGINRAIADVAARARAGKLRVDDFGGGTFTVDNTGLLGSNLTMPIINVPEVAILTMEEIRKRAVVVETPDGAAIGIRPVMNMVLGIDHRAIDGAGGAAFLRDVKAWLEAVGPETPIY